MLAEAFQANKPLKSRYIDFEKAAMELIQYLNEHFFTCEQLLARSGIDARDLEDWQARRMMPRASYRLRLQIGCDSFFGPHMEEHALDYFAKGYVEWIATLRSLPNEDAAREEFARRYRERLGRAGIAPNSASLSSDEHIAAEWRHFLDGTYGLCTVTGLPEDIAAKEVAIAVIREMDVENYRALDENSRVRLRQAVDLLDTASAPFAPHEAARSSRRRYVDDMRKAYDLPS
jgi:hypothetical protein